MSPKTPNLRQKIVAALTRLYPLYSGCSALANSAFVEMLGGASKECVWARVTGGAHILSPLDDYVGRAAFYVGDLDRKISWICAQLVRPGDTVLDIGANIGIVSMHLSSLVGPKGKVHSFEPNPRLQNFLEQALEYNRVSNVVLHRFALGEEAGETTLSIPPFNAGAASMVPGRIDGNAQTIRVPVFPLSRVADEAGIDSIQFIKIDVEGFEPQVLRGARHLLARTKPQAILFELNNWSGNLREHPTIQVLSELGYLFFSVPKCLFRMSLQPWDSTRDVAPPSHDFVAAPRGEKYAKVAQLLKVRAT